MRRIGAPSNAYSKGRRRRSFGPGIWLRRDLRNDFAAVESRRPGWRRFEPTPGRVTLIVLTLGLLWRTVRYAVAFPLWGDEAFVACNVLTRGLAGLGRALDYGQVAPPGFLAAEWQLARWLGASEWALRLVPALSGAAALLLFWQLARGVATRRSALLAVALLAASFYPVRHANEVKPYAVDLLVATALTLLGASVWRDPGRTGRWLGLCAVSVVGVWCSYTAVFPIAGVGLLLATRLLRARSRSFLARFLAFSGLSAASWVAMLVLFMGPQARETAWLAGLVTWRDAFPPLAAPWKLPRWLLEVHTGNMLAYPIGGNQFGSTPTALLVLAGAYAVWRSPARRPLLALVVGPLLATFAAAAIHRYPYGTSARTSLYMAPAFCLLAAEGAMALGRRLRVASRGPLVLAGLLGVVPVAGAACDLVKPYVRLNNLAHRRVVGELAARTGPHDQWVVFNGTVLHPKRADDMLSRWLARSAEVRFYLLSLAPVPLRWEPDPAQLAIPRDGRLWLIVHRHGSLVEFPHARHDQYLRDVVTRLGWPARTWNYDLADRERFEVYVFGGG